MDVDVEGSCFPYELGEIDQDIPVWKGEFDEEDNLRIKDSDAGLKVRHITMMNAVLSFVLENDLDKLRRTDYAIYARGEIKSERDEHPEDEPKNIVDPVLLSPFEEEENRTLALALTESFLESFVSSVVRDGIERVLRASTGKEINAPAMATSSAVAPFQIPPLSCFEAVGCQEAINWVAKTISLLSFNKRAAIHSLNLDGCVNLDEKTLVVLLASLPNLLNLRLNGLVSCVGEQACVVIGTLKRLRYLDMSNCALNDRRLETLVSTLAKIKVRVRKLNIANSGALTDEGLKVIGKDGGVASTLVDFCMSGCFRITDLGLMLISFPNFKRLNFCGSYKVTDASRRYILGQNPTLLIYNASNQFGRAGIESERNNRTGTFYDHTAAEIMKEEDSGEQASLEEFRK